MARGRGGRPPSPTGRPCPAYKRSASERAGGRDRAQPRQPLHQPWLGHSRPRLPNFPEWLGCKQAPGAFPLLSCTPPLCLQHKMYYNV